MLRPTAKLKKPAKLKNQRYGAKKLLKAKTKIGGHFSLQANLFL